VNDELLSRMAETLFWTGRYVERADDTARLVDVYVHRILSESKTQEGLDCGPLFGLLGIDAGPRLLAGPRLFAGAHPLTVPAPFQARCHSPALGYHRPWRYSLRSFDDLY
jgi:A predicted alpha-helical domain with a conserved ER motif.